MYAFVNVTMSQMHALKSVLVQIHILVIN